MRLLVVAATVALGFFVAEGASACGAGLAPSAVFVPLEQADDCRRACTEARRVAPGPAAPLVIGYGACAPGLLSAHRAHRCADVVVRLTAAAGRPRFAHLPAADAITAAGLTDREADVLVLLLRGLTTAGVGCAPLHRSEHGAHALPRRAAQARRR